jgi:hypothetical protein
MSAGFRILAGNLDSKDAFLKERILTPNSQDNFNGTHIVGPKSNKWFGVFPAFVSECGWFRGGHSNSMSPQHQAMLYALGLVVFQGRQVGQGGGCGFL